MSPSTPVLALTSALLGVTSHLTYFIHSHHPFYHCTFIALTFLLTPIVSLVFLTRIASFPLHEALRLVAVTWWSFTGSIWLSMGIYRTFFHRLRGYPGPFLAKLSQLWRVWRNLRKENYLVLDELHRTYGEYVRVGMYVSMNSFALETRIDVKGKPLYQVGPYGFFSHFPIGGIVGAKSD